MRSADLGRPNDPTRSVWRPLTAWTVVLDDEANALDIAFFGRISVGSSVTLEVQVSNPRTGQGGVELIHRLLS
jgi:hypothetical protein